MTIQGRTTGPEQKGDNMREILFRGKRIDNGEWVTGSLLVWPDGQMEICTRTSSEETQMDKLTVYPETVGQFIGLTDKNGKKVFEGDILRIWNVFQQSYVGKCIVKYGRITKFGGDGVYGWYLDGGDIHDLVDYCGMEYEICGNIHDTTELLGGGSHE